MARPSSPPSTSGGGMRAFDRLWFCAIASNFGDGMMITAVPLLGARLTRDPLLISLLGAMTFLPWLFLAILAGTAVDVLDRRRVLIACNAVRAVVVGALAWSVGAGTVTIAVLLVAVFALGSLETLTDSASVALTPVLAGRERLERATSRLTGAQVVVHDLLTAPAAAYLFGVAAAVPFCTAAGSYAAAGLLAVAIPAVGARALAARASDGDASRPADTATADDAPGPADVSVPGSQAPADRPADRVGPGARIREGLTYLLGHRRLRRLWAISILLTATLQFAQSTRVLFFLDVLGVPEQAYGLMTLAPALGGIAGALTARVLAERIGRGTALLVAGSAGGLASLAVGLSPGIGAAVAALTLSGWAIGVWNVMAMAVRLRFMPGHLVGRLHGVWRTAMWGVIPLATAAGGLVSRWDLRAVWILGGAAGAVSFLVLHRTIRSYDHVHDGDLPVE